MGYNYRMANDNWVIGCIPSGRLLINDNTLSDTCWRDLRSAERAFTCYLLGISPVNSNQINPSGRASSPSPLGPSLALGRYSVAS